MEENIKKTCLWEDHVKLGAKMSPFAGFDMPIQYEGITEEHMAVRQQVGMFDVSHMGEIFISGEDAVKFINHIFTNDVKVNTTISSSTNANGFEFEYNVTKMKGIQKTFEQLILFNILSKTFLFFV